MSVDYPEGEPRRSKTLSKKTRPQQARPLGNKARAFIQDMQIVVEGFSEQAMAIAAAADDIDALITQALYYMEQGSREPAMTLLRSTIAKTSKQRVAAGEIVTKAAAADKRFERAIGGKYE